MFDLVLNNPLITTSLSFYSKKTFYFHLGLIVTNMSWIFKWTRQEINTSEYQKFENVHIFIKCALEYIYNMLHMPSNRTAQQKLQHRTKLYNKEHNALHNNIYQKMIFFSY